MAPRIARRTILALPCALLAQPSAEPDDYQGVQRVVAVGDVHGDCDALVAVLKMAGLVDRDGHWSGGRTHLVQIGDIPSRGPQTRKALDFLMGLEKQAINAGGRVHALIGNHDAGVIYGDLRNVLPAEYAEFRQPDSEAQLEKAFEQHLAEWRAGPRPPKDQAELDGIRKTWFEQHPPGFVEHRRAFAPDAKYGLWIRQHNAAVRINDTLFVHGGISPKHATLSRSRINQTIRRELANPASLPPGLTTDVQGPLWYRGLAEGEESQLQSHVNAALRFHGVRRIVIGHTVTRTAILPRFGSRIVNIDLGLSRFYGRPPACLVIDGSRLEILHNAVSISLPGPKPDHTVDYLKACAAADPQPSLFESLIRRAESSSAGRLR